MSQTPSVLLAADPVRFDQHLRRSLAQPLPGPLAQALMAPNPRPGWILDSAPEGLRQGAALALILLDPRPSLILTVRDPGLALHGGQVSLPGGGVIEGEGLFAAALREAEEETGVPPTLVELLGPLTPLHIPVSGYLLHPFVGLARRRLVLQPRVGEVARIIEAPIAALIDPARQIIETWPFRGQDYQIPLFHVDGEKVWGATAMIVGELLALLGWPPVPRPAAPVADAQN